MGFKDLMKSFLYENVEDDDDDEEEEEELVSSTPVRPAAQPAAKPVQQAASPAPAAAPAPTPAQPTGSDQALPENLEAYYTQPKVSTPAVSGGSQGSFLNRIDTDLTEPEPATQKSKRVSRIHTARASARSQLPRQNYAAVISPIFGNLPDSEKNPSALHDAINLPKPADTFEMVEIISPMFGTGPTHVQQVSSQMTPVAQAPDSTAQTETSEAALSKSKKAAPSKAGQPAADAEKADPALPAEMSELALPAPAEEPQEEQTQSVPPKAPQKTAAKKQNADLSAYLSRGTNPKSTGKSTKNYSKSKKGGRSR